MNDSLNEWEQLIDELPEKQHLLWELKDQYEEDSQEIINNTDFKEIYGRNNEGIRKMHVKQELHDSYVEINELKIEIADIERRISFLREKAKFERVLLELQKQ